MPHMPVYALLAVLEVLGEWGLSTWIPLEEILAGYRTHPWNGFESRIGPFEHLLNFVSSRIARPSDKVCSRAR